MKDSTFDFGPCYNPITKNGLPVLGAWEKPAETYIAEKSGRQSLTPLNSYVPLSGIVKVNGISLDNTHDINFHFGFREDIPSLISQQDIDVCVILVFIEKLSDFPDCKLIQTHEYNLYRKEWPIRWLGYTDLGKTLYTCQQYLDALVFNLSDFLLAPKDTFFEPEWYPHILDMLGDMEYVIVKSKVKRLTHTTRIVIKDFFFQENEGVKNESCQNNNWHLKILDTAISFEVLENQENLQSDPISSFLDYNIDAFTQLMPVFERYRQLVSLFYGLTKLRNAGYLMPEEMVENYKLKKNSFTNLISASNNDFDCRLLPLF
ncbi:MAG: hypothetical protein J0L77_00380 [Alphaproteobacteria bacterium]|nr:hypothetical protein [Alphaproteobacteria bacterium]